MLHAVLEIMTPSSELSFDCKPYMQPSQKLEEFLARLEEERLKIDAFKRELPLCMQLLNNAMEESRQQLESQRSMNEGGRPVLEEFIPLKNTSSEFATDQNNNSADKANWMTSAQLWNQESENTLSPKENNDHMKVSLNGKQRVINGGAFVPFSLKDRNFPPFPELALASSVSQKEEMELDAIKNSSESNSRRENINNSISEKAQPHGAANTTSQAQRKARRCWSPDLHRRFVNALQLLGGPQVATPKQIRELMKVDGLTNDEVKSHLQKYRLHTRRPSPNSQSTPAAPQVVVLGGIWVPPEYAAAAAAHGGAQATALYGPHTNTSHHLSPIFCSAPTQVAHEIYPANAAPPQPPNYLLHHHHHQLQGYNQHPVNSSADSDVQGVAGDPSESIEDGKSESGSWKADSGWENGGEGKRHEGEESNASVVMSLKF